MTVTVQVTNLEKQFHEAMLGIYRAALRLKPPYRATRFLNMVTELGGREAANRLLATKEPSEGFAELLLRGRENLKISVEYLVLSNPWRELFANEQLGEARKRLNEHECEPPPDEDLIPDSRIFETHPC